MKTLQRAISAVFAVTLAVILIPVAPASGEDCNGACSKKRASCDSSCEDRKVRCVLECGVPLLPGYDKCRQTCDDNLRVCSLECAGNQKICEASCKLPQ